MIPAGYLLKRVVPPPGWLAEAPTHIKEVCSVSGCVNDNIVDLIPQVKNNSFGVASSPEILSSLAKEAGLEPLGSALFYYEAYEFILESDGWDFDPKSWSPRTAENGSVTIALPNPTALQLLGYDVVVIEYSFVHSPLSCNSVAGEISVNKHCLFDEFSDAKAAIDTGRFAGGCEPGDYSIYSVHLVEPGPHEGRG